MQKLKFKQTEIGEIPGDWIAEPLSKYVLFSRNGIYKGEEFQGNGISIVKMGTLFANYFIKNQEMELLNLTDKEKEIFLLKKGDLIFARTSLVLEGVGKCAIIMTDSREITFESNTFCIRLSSDKINPLFILYFFGSKIGRHFIGAIANETAATSIRSSDLITIPLPIPPKKEQDGICKILLDFDLKIELLQQQNKTLESISKTIFKQWFVDFDFPNAEGKPYKSSGGEMVESELGDIPDRWEIKTINELTSKFTTGLNPRKNFVLGNGKNYYVTIKNMTDNQEIILNDNCDKVDDEALKKINNRADLKKNDILFSGVATIGRTFFIDETPTNWNINESIFTLRAKNNQISTYILYNLLISRNFQSYAQRLASGSVQRGIRLSDLKNFKFCLPELHHQETISKSFEIILLKQKNNIRKISILSRLKDLLLPKLMSGKIRVPHEN